MKKSSKKLITLLGIGLLCLFSLFNKELFAAGPVVPHEEGTLEVHAIDVDQGASTLIKAGGKAVLIDTGEKAFCHDVLSYLKGEGVKKIDALFITHPHTDHYGASLEIMEKLPVEKAYLPIFDKEVLHDGGLWDEMVYTLENKGTEVHFLDEKIDFHLGNEVKLSVLGPFLKNPKKINDISLCFKITCGDTSFLITGDGEKAVEEALMKEDIRADVLFSGHHGSKTSSNEFFTDKVRPQASLVSVGFGNSHGLPDRCHIENLLKWGDVFRTDLDGSVVFTSDGKNIDVFTEKMRT